MARPEAANVAVRPRAALPRRRAAALSRRPPGVIGSASRALPMPDWDIGAIVIEDLFSLVEVPGQPPRASRPGAAKAAIARLLTLADAKDGGV